MERKLAVFDIDGVLYGGHTIFEIIQRQEKEGFIKEGTWKLIENELYAYKTNKKTYKEAANQMLVVFLAALRGKSYKEVKDNVRKFLKGELVNFYPYFAEILPTLKKTHDVYLITTNLHVTAETLTEIYELQGFLSTEEEVVDGIYTGNVTRSLAGEKKIIRELFTKYKREGSIAVGDSVNDIDMLLEVETPICMNPDSKLSIYAKEYNWRVVNENTVNECLREIL